MVTAAVVDEARARATTAAAAAAESADERTMARSAVESTRTAALEAVRSDDRNEVEHQTARAARQRVAEDRLALASELEEVRRTAAELDDRIARDTARAVELREQLPILEAARTEAAGRAAAAREERKRIDERIAEAASVRSEWEVRSAGLVERRRVLSERLAEVDRRLTGHADERRQAAERRTRLEADATAVDRLLAVVGSAQSQLDSALAELRERYRLQIEAVRAGGARLEELRRQRSAHEHELAAVRGRLQKVELDLVEATIRRESVIESLRRELACGPDEALSAPEPELPEGSDPSTRIVELEAELAALGPVNPLALEELSELGERHQFLESQVEDVRSARRELHHVIRTLDEEIMHVFDSAFADVNEHFSTLVTSLFPGGTGRLSLTDPENLLDTGVEVEVRPAGRNVRRLSLLSGGERSLVALAFLFAVFRSRPSPFYLMDEVEAALDDVNLQRFLGLVHEFREGAQLIIVSHQKRTMEAADALYGVTMAPGGSSKVVSQKVPRHRSDGLEWSDGETGVMAPPPAPVGAPAPAPIPPPPEEASRDGHTSGRGARQGAGPGPEPVRRARVQCAESVSVSESVPVSDSEPRSESRPEPEPDSRSEPRSEVRPGAGPVLSVSVSSPDGGVPQHGGAQQHGGAPQPGGARQPAGPRTAAHSPAAAHSPVPHRPAPPSPRMAKGLTGCPPTSTSTSSGGRGRDRQETLRSGARRGHRPVMGPDLLVATSDVAVGLFVAIPVVVVAGGVAVGLRLRGRGRQRACAGRRGGQRRSHRRRAGPECRCHPAGHPREAPPRPTGRGWRRRRSSPHRSSRTTRTGRARSRPNRPPTGVVWARPAACSPATWERSGPRARSTPPPGMTWRRPSSGPMWGWVPPMPSSTG